MRTEQLLKPKIVRHLILCCNYECLKYEMGVLINILPKSVVVSKVKSRISVENEEWIFLSNINKDPYRIYGLEFTDYKTCGHFVADHKVLNYLQTHINR